MALPAFMEYVTHSSLREIAKSRVRQPGRIAAGTSGQILLFQKKDIESKTGGMGGSTASHDSASNND